jgi:DNA-directed RNA polymerase subunit omega
MIEEEKKMPVNKPAIDELCEKVDCRYTLVVEAAKRARELVGGAQPLIDPKDKKPVSIAVDEINRGLLSYHRNLEDEEV